MTQRIRVKFGPNPYDQTFSRVACGRSFRRGGHSLTEVTDGR